MRPRAVAPALAFVLGVACAPPPNAPPSPPASVGPKHVHIVRRLGTPERRAAFAAFAAANPGTWAWQTPDQIDAFDGHLIDARRTDPAPAGPLVDRAAAEASALRFLERNARALGLSSEDVLRLDLEAPPESPGDLQPGEQPVLAHAEVPMKGFLSFPALRSTIRILLGVDGRGEVRRVANASTMHPRIALTVDPKLPPDDPRVVARLLGRRLFAVVLPVGFAEEDLPRTAVHDGLRKLELGVLAREDVRRVRPDVHVSEGPLGAYRVYRLVYVVEVAKALPEAGFCFFAFTVDADTGELVEDARVPTIAGGPRG